MLLTNARIYPMTDGLPAAPAVADTLLLRHGRIVFCGRRSEVNAPAAEPVLDLDGRAVLPGLVDSHGYLMYLARARLTLDVGGFTSEEAIATRVGQAAARVPKGQWLGGRGWDQNRWPGMRMPSRTSLAAVTRSGADRGWQPGQRMTREEAVRSFTSWNAEAAHQEGETGTLEAGKRADLIVLDEDVFTCPEARIKDIAPVLTMVGGEIVYRRGS